MFTGALAEFIFYDKRDKIWDHETKTFHYFGDEKKTLRYTTVEDAAAYTIEAVQAPGAEYGGCIRVQSFEVSPADVVAAYESAHGTTAHSKCVGSIEHAEKMLEKARSITPLVDHDSYIGLSYAIHMAGGTWEYNPSDNARFSNIKPTGLREFFSAHPDL